MMTIISGVTNGIGKTSLMTYFLNESAYNRERIQNGQRALKELSMSLNMNIDIPEHFTYLNGDATFFKLYHDKRKNLVLYPEKFGIQTEAPEGVKCQYIPEWSTLGIDEAQIYLNSRMAQYYPAWQSRWYEAHGHNNLDIFLATQRPGLIDVNIRELASFIEVLDLKVKYDIYDEPCRLVWQVRSIPYARMYDKYVSSGGFDKSCYEELEIVADYNVFSVYDSQSCKPKFYDGYLRYVESEVQFDCSKIDYGSFSLDDDTAQSYIKYLETFKDDYPENFYVKKLGSDEERNKKARRKEIS